MKIDCLKSTKDLVDSLIIYKPSNLEIVIVGYVLKYIYLSIFQLELRADRAPWPSSKKNILVSPIFADELLVQIQYMKIIKNLVKWSY